MRFKPRRTRLNNKLESLLRNKITSNDIENILKFVDEYEKDNLATIEILKKTKAATTKKINGALKATIDAHGPITKTLIGSATKRIYGSILEQPQKTLLQKIIAKFNNKF